jgi:hypothetical protein
MQYHFHRKRKREREGKRERKCSFKLLLAYKNIKLMFF